MSIRKALSAVAVIGPIAASLVAGFELSASTARIGIGGQHQTTFTPGRYIVTLADPVVATYRGGVKGYAATKADAGKQLTVRAKAAQTYSEYLSTQQRDVARAAAVTIDQWCTLALNAFSATITVKQLAALPSDRKVASLAPDELRHVTATPSTSFLGLDGTGGV